jgi:hypothetical protein
MRSAEDYADFLEEVEQKFGTSEVVEAVVYPSTRWSGYP